MKYYVQFMLICLFAVIGEAISTFFKLPIPGSIIGLFLPAGVGIMERWNAISENIVPIILIIMGALVLNIVVIAIVVVFIKKHFEGDYEEVKRG